MQVFTSKCPNCGASIELGELGTAIRCLACGSDCLFCEDQAVRLIVQRDPKEGEGALHLAQQAYTAGNTMEAYIYANKVLEINPGHAEAWLLKGLSAGWLGTTEKHRFEEVVLGFQECIDSGGITIAIDFGHSEAVKIVDTYIECWCNKFNDESLRPEFERALCHAVMTLRLLFSMSKAPTLALEIHRLAKHPKLAGVRAEMGKWLKDNNVPFQELQETEKKAKSGCMVLVVLLGFGGWTVTQFIRHL